MKKKIWIATSISLAVIIVGFSVFVGIRFHVPRNPTYTQTDCGNFRLYISVESTRVRRRQGLDVMVTFKNLSGREMHISHGSRFMAPFAVGREGFWTGESIHRTIEVDEVIRRETSRFGSWLPRGRFEIIAKAEFAEGWWGPNTTFVTSNRIVLTVF